MEFQLLNWIKGIKLFFKITITTFMIIFITSYIICKKLTLAMNAVSVFLNGRMRIRYMYPYLCMRPPKAAYLTK